MFARKVIFDGDTDKILLLYYLLSYARVLLCVCIRRLRSALVYVIAI